MMDKRHNDFTPITSLCHTNCASLKQLNFNKRIIKSTFGLDICFLMWSNLTTLKWKQDYQLSY